MNALDWTAEAAVLAAILANPADDTPRLVYADWLDEHNQPERAEFIRVQIGLANTGRCKDECRNRIDYECRGCTLRGRERELWGYLPRQDGIMRQFTSILPGVAVLLDGDTGKGLTHDYPWAHVRRGFVESVTCSWEAFDGGECENCGGFGEFRRRHDNGDGPEGPCPNCGGKWNSGPHDDLDDYWDKGTSRTPGLAAALVWSPEVKCPNCRDEGCSGTHSHPGKAGQIIHGILHQSDPRKAHHHHDHRCRYNCSICSGTGRVPNPTPPPATAQPVREVVLTEDIPSALRPTLTHPNYPQICFRVASGGSIEVGL